MSQFPRGNNLIRRTDLVLDPANRRVTRAGVRIQLTSKQYTILELLMQNAGEAVSRMHLMESVWSETSEGLNKVLDAHICNLRRKIDYDSAASLIQTVRGFGFRLSPTQSARSLLPSGTR